MKQIVSQNFELIIIPNNNREFVLVTRHCKHDDFCSFVKTTPTKNISDTKDEVSDPYFYIIYCGYQGEFTLGRYQSDKAAKRAMRVLSDYLSDMHWELTDKNGEPYFDGDVLIMPDEDGNSQLYKDFDNGDEDNE